MLGIDIVQINRIEKACKNPAFPARVFTDSELAYYRSGGGRAETLAGIYALKEAAAKALGTGFRGFGPKDVEIAHDKSGAPRVVFHGPALALFNQTGAKSVECSVSHEKEYAAAVCLILIL